MLKETKAISGGKVAIISDIHNNEVNLKKVLDYCGREKIQTIICCGDLANAETLDFLNDNFSGTIYYTFGNMDNGQLQNYPPRLAETRRREAGEFTDRYKNTFIYKNFGEIEIANQKIAFVHFPDKAKQLCETGKYQYVFYGHTHKPWTESINDCGMLNPGNVAGEIYPPTFAIWNTDPDKFELVRVHDLK